MRIMIAIVAGIFLTIGVASASDTGFGDWGKASYDEVMDSRVINYSSFHSPEPMVESKTCGYSGMNYGSAADSSSSCSWNAWSNEYYGPVEYGDDDWDWYTL